MWKQIQFIWGHLGAFRKIIIAGCILMTKASDILGFLPDHIKNSIAGLLPCWPWYWWLIAALVLIAAFSIEESYLRQYPKDKIEKNKGLPTVALAMIALAWIISVVICHYRERSSTPPPNTPAQQSITTYDPQKDNPNPKTTKKLTKTPAPTTPPIAPVQPPIVQSVSGDGAGAVGTLTQGPGSIAQVGGHDNTAIIGNKDWKLSKKDQDNLIEVLKLTHGSVQVQWQTMDSVSLLYSEQLAYAFHEARWTIEDNVPNYAGMMCYPSEKWDCRGARVELKDPNSDFGKAVISALDKPLAHPNILTNADRGATSVGIIITRSMPQ
jgi:hypothetical protein